jgi:predicted transcriptional regulator of viral defense system
MISQTDIRLEEWTVQLLASGRFAFSLEDLKRAMPLATPVSLKRSLSRETAKGNILSVHRGYYIIIPPSHKTRGILPPSLFIDGLMTYLERPYYVALLNAAAWHGASHQQPQEFFVVTGFPVMRPTEKKGIRIRYISKNEIPAGLTEQKNTDTGTVQLSGPLLTAADLVQYEKHIGGISRAATILVELAEKIKPSDPFHLLVEHSPVSVLQRLGYLLEEITGHYDLANTLHRMLQENDAALFRTPLKTGEPQDECPVNERWKVILNTGVETDFIV